VIGKGCFIAVHTLLIAAGLYLNLHRDLGVPMKAPLESFPYGGESVAHDEGIATLR
jgi:hypothetical protein